MTRFSRIEGSPHYLTETLFPETSCTALEAMTDFGLTVTDAINEMIATHKWATDVKRAGGILLARTGVRLEVLDIPPLKVVDGGVRDLTVNLLPQWKAYLEPMASEYDPIDLVSFWESASSFYCELIDRHGKGHELLQIKHDLSHERFEYNIGPPG